jgi:DNA-binding transcriptional MocR family regulator
MWCVPKFSNPTGTVYSKEVVTRIAKLGLKANSNFRVFWDNAYAVHDLEDGIELHNIFDEAKKHGTEDSILIFGSTSKITLAGSGIGFLGTTEANLKSFKEYLSIQTIGPDKVNQLRHVSFFKDYENILSHMKGHREILKPKFDLTLKILEEEFEGSNFLSWTVPKGGYFVSVDTLPGLATEVVQVCASLGVKYTPAGSTYPYMKDPEDKNIRIAPSMPSIDSIETAMRVFCKVVKLLSLKKLN